MQFGVALPQFGPKARGAEVGERIRAMASAADRLGYDVVWTAEHLVFPRRIETPYPYGGSFPYDVNDPVLDVGATLAFVAAATKRVRLGSAVVVLPYHHPVALAKAIATVDVLSGGRVLLGVASGWLREEFELLGVPFRERGARTDEAIDLLRALWTEETVHFEGRFHGLRDAAFSPKPAQRPLPIWIGGDSPKALRRVGRRGDGWLAAPRDLATLERAIDEVRREAESAGRDPTRIGVASGGGARSVAELVDLLPRLERIGVTIVNVPALFWSETVEEAIDLLEDFAVRGGLRATAASP
ncbi:MAG: LLM class F420-dependent oxidoreductase [Deltaproteobacteria bacterium]|nr:LLM class F420-dependent oxidoreductase [Deltaproteobacteria bacterium]